MDESIRKHLVGHSNGVHGDVYTVFRVLEDQLRLAVAHIPPVQVPNLLTLDGGYVGGNRNAAAGGEEKP